MKKYFFVAGILILTIFVILLLLLRSRTNVNTTTVSPTPYKGEIEPPPPSMNPTFAQKIKDQPLWTKLPYYTKNYSITYLDSADMLVVTTYLASQTDRIAYLEQAKQWISQNGGKIDTLRIELSPPWYSRFPFTNELYTISYNIEEDRFYGIIFPSKQVPISPEQQADALKREGLVQLKNIGVDTSKYSVTWEVRK